MKRADLVRYNVHLERRQLDALARIYDDRGVTPAEQIRRAIDAYLATETRRSPKPRPPK
jgi:hypothetical protein